MTTIAKKRSKRVDNSVFCTTFAAERFKKPFEISFTENLDSFSNSRACGEIGRRARLRIWCFATCRFESYHAHDWMKRAEVFLLFFVLYLCDCHTEHSEVSTSRSLLHFIGSVEIYCGFRFLSPLYSTVVLNLNCSLIFSSSLSFPTFHRVKSSKSARHRQN